VPWTNEDCKTFQHSLKSPSTSSSVPLPWPPLLLSPLVDDCVNQPAQPRVKESGTVCCLVQYCGQSRIARYCECQDALLRTRTCRPSFFIMPPPLNNSAFSFPSTILEHDRTSTTIWLWPLHIFLQLYHLPLTFIPLTHFNSQLLP
jgi:hypothetical protein